LFLLAFKMRDFISQSDSVPGAEGLGLRQPAAAFCEAACCRRGLKDNHGGTTRFRLCVSSLLLLLTSLILSSCASVVSKTVIGDKPAKLKVEDWEGTWMSPDKHVVHIRAKDTEDGVLEVAWVEEKNKHFVLESHEMILREHGDWLWANMKEGDGGTYFFGRVTKPKDDQILGWSASAPGFVEAIHASKIKGELMKNPDGKESGSVLLEGLGEAELKAIEQGEIKGLFLWDHPLVLMKVSAQK
jgi:hypothetical protein